MRKQLILALALLLVCAATAHAFGWAPPGMCGDMGPPTSGDTEWATYQGAPYIVGPNGDLWVWNFETEDIDVWERRPSQHEDAAPDDAVFVRGDRVLAIYNYGAGAYWVENSTNPYSTQQAAGSASVYYP